MKYGIQRGKKKDISEIELTTKELLKKTSKDDKYNTKVLNHIVQINKIVKPVLDDPVDIQKCIDTYFNICRANGIRPTLSGLALAIGVSRFVLLQWANGETRLQNKEIIKSAIQMIEIFIETSMESGNINPIPAIFLLKNNHGYTDNTTIKIENTNVELTLEQIKKKYLEETSIIEADIEDK